MEKKPRKKEDLADMLSPAIIGLVFFGMVLCGYLMSSNEQTNTTKVSTEIVDKDEDRKIDMELRDWVEPYIIWKLFNG